MNLEQQDLTMKQYFELSDDLKKEYDKIMEERIRQERRNTKYWWIVRGCDNNKQEVSLFRFWSSKNDLKKNIKSCFRINKQEAKESNGFFREWAYLEVESGDTRLGAFPYYHRYNRPKRLGTPTDTEYENISKRLG